MKPLAPALALTLLATLAPCPTAFGQVVSTTTTTTTVVHTEPNFIVPQIGRRPWHQHPAPIEVTAVNANITIDEQVAGTTLELTLTNRGSSNQEAVILLPVPDGVVVRSLQYDGTGPEPTAKVLPRDEARAIYDGIVRKMRDPALVEFSGYNLIKTSAFPIPAGRSQRLSLTYEQVLPQDSDRVDYALPRSEALADGDAAWTINADIRSKRPIATVYSPSHEMDVKRVDAHHIQIGLTGKRAAEPGAVRFSYLLEKARTVTASTIAYPDPTIGDGKGGFFTLLAGLPTDLGSDLKSVKREIVLVLDRSGSMKGDKIKQVIAAATQIIEGLEPGEAFNIIDYSDSIQSFADKPVIKDAKTAADAKAYIAKIQANGGTNINDALVEALRSEPTPGMLPVILFLTDGRPTVGERSEVKIREAIKAANKNQRRIFSFGVGLDVNTPLLSGLSSTTRGAGTFVLPDEDVEIKVSQVFRRLSGPVLASPKITVLSADGSSDTRALREMLPAELPDLFDGDQLVLTGQYTSERPVTIRLEGEYLGKKTHFDFPLDVSKASTRHAYIPRIWANRKIATLIDAVRQAGAESGSNAATKELVDEIIALSTKYGILTEYTAFLATDEKVGFDTPAKRADADHEVRRQLESRAVRDRSGAGSVNQELNLSKMQAPAAPASGGGSAGRKYLADDLKEVEIRTVQNVADRSYFQRNNRWVESTLLATENEKPDRTIEFGSDDYLKLVADLAKVNRQSTLALGGDVLIQVGKERVLVKAP